MQDNNFVDIRTSYTSDGFRTRNLPIILTHHFHHLQTVNTIKAFPPDNGFPLEYREAGSIANQESNFRLGRPRIISATTALQTVMHEGTVSTALFPDCFQAYKNHGKISKYYASDLEEAKQLCVLAAASNSTNGPCDVGAWGSPLYELQPDDGSILQVGLYSQGYCATSDEAVVLPHIYTRLAHYADWIQSQVCLHAHPTPPECGPAVRRRRSLRSGGYK